MQMKRWFLQIKAVQSIDERLNAFGANLHPSHVDLGGKCLLRIETFSQPISKVVPLENQQRPHDDDEADEAPRPSSRKRAAKHGSDGNVVERPRGECSFQFYFRCRLADLLS